MTNDPVIQRLRELSWRRTLTDAEAAELRAWLTLHPDANGEWETEAALTQALTQLPAPPLSSNFTAQVMNAIARGEVTAARPRIRMEWWRTLGRIWRPAPGIAMAGLVLGGSLLAYRHHEHARTRQELAHSVAMVSDLAAVSNTELLANFEAIRVLNQAPQADEQLLALLQ
jgi:anti-sigma factor RsiW